MNDRIIFFSLVTILVFGIAFFTAKVYTSGFRLPHQLSKNIIILVLLVPLFYVASFIASRSVQYGIGPVIYTIINALAGIFYYLFIGAVILGLIIAITNIFGQVVPVWLTAGMFSVFLLLALASLVQARFMKTTEYTVTLSGAPESWNNKTAVLVSDTHFGLVNYKKYSDKVVSKILSLKPDFVMHAGDFYDGPEIDTAPITESWKKLANQTPVFYAPGNHEEYGDYNKFIESTKAAGITVLDNKKTEYDGVQIVGITYYPGANPEHVKEILTGFSMNTNPSILINHPPTSLAAAETDGIDLMVSGHTHNGQFWPNNFIIARAYGIYKYGLNQFKNMQVLTTSGVGTFGPPMRLFNTPEVVLIHFKTK